MINAGTKKARILIVPLNWGLGHATRLIPLIGELMNMGFEVLTGGSPAHLKLLRSELPNLKTINFPYLKIRLTGNSSQILSIFLQLPVFLFQIIREHQALRKVIRKEHIAAVISDNCYGLWNPSIYSVFITHQLNIKIPRHVRFFEKWINCINSYFIRKYDACWVPDCENDGGFAGELSFNANKLPFVSYIGILSRFFRFAPPIVLKNNTSSKKILFILSGPEKQRSIFEERVKKEVFHIPDGYEYTIVRGQPAHSEPTDTRWLNHASSEEMYRLIAGADIIICRAGYSTIMDLLATGKPAVLVPTPGQTEQEYLADYLSAKNYFHSCSQQQFNLAQIISAIESQRPVTPQVSINKTAIRTALNNLLQ